MRISRILLLLGLLLPMAAEAQNKKQAPEPWDIVDALVNAKDLNAWPLKRSLFEEMEELDNLSYHRDKVVELVEYQQKLLFGETLAEAGVKPYEVCKKGQNGEYSFRMVRPYIVRGNAYSYPFDLPEMKNHPDATVIMTVSKSTLKIEYNDDCQLECVFHETGNHLQKGAPKKPADPYKEAFACKGGGQETTEATVVYNCDNVHPSLSKHFKKLKAKATRTCTHKNWQFNITAGAGKVMTAGGPKMNAGAQYYNPWKFKHSMTATINLDDMAKRAGMDKKDMMIQLAKGMYGVVYGSMTSPITLSDTERLNLAYCIYKTFGISAQDEFEYFSREHVKELCSDEYNYSSEEKAFFKQGGDSYQKQELLDKLKKHTSKGLDKINKNSKPTNERILDVVRIYDGISEIQKAEEVFKEMIGSVGVPGGYTSEKFNSYITEGRTKLKSVVKDYLEYIEKMTDREKKKLEYQAIDFTISQQMAQLEDLKRLLYDANVASAKLYIEEGEPRNAYLGVKVAEQLFPDEAETKALRSQYDDCKKNEYKYKKAWKKQQKRK